MKALRLFPVLLILMLLVSACGGDATPTPQAASPAATTATGGSAATSAPAGDTPTTGSSGGSSSDLSGKLTIAGSSAMLPLIQQAATNFQKANKGVSIALSAGGSGAGRSGVCKGDLNIGDSDVPLSDKEKSDLNCQSAVETNVAHQAFVVSANPQGPGKVTNLSKAQIQDIFSGKTTNWKDLGGDDQKIVVVNRTKGSGTRATMAKYLYGGDDTKFVTGASEEANNETAYQTTKQTPGAVTYLGLSYGQQSDIITFSIDNVKPTTATVKDGTWPITGPALMITKGAPDGVAKSFIDYVTGPFQADPAFNTLGFVPVK